MSNNNLYMEYLSLLFDDDVPAVYIVADDDESGEVVLSECEEQKTLAKE